MALLVDVMTTRGHLMAISRHGINRKDNGCLQKYVVDATMGMCTYAPLSLQAVWQSLTVCFVECMTADCRAMQGFFRGNSGDSV
jgi:hypothetical protein